MSLFHRAFRICDDVSLPEEIDTIKAAFVNLKYPKWLINQALNTSKSRFHNPITKVHKKASHHLSLPEHPTLKPLTSVLRKIDIGTSFYSGNTLRRQLTHTGPEKSTDSPGTYIIECTKCPHAYFGETSKPLSTRLDQHKRKISLAQTDSALFIHMRDNLDHRFNFKDARLIFKSEFLTKREMVESALIAIKPNCNISSGRFALCKLSANLVLKSVNIDTAPQQSPLHHSPSHVDILDRAPSIEPAPALDTDSVTESSQPVVNPSQLGNAFTDPQDSSSLVTNIPPSNIAATQTIAAIYSTPPVSQRSRSKFRHQPYPSNGSSSTNDSPLFLQSQARALPLSMVGPLSYFLPFIGSS